MKKLSFTQEYFLCAVNKKGELPVLNSSSIASCLVAGGIMELTEHGFISKDEKKNIIISKPWNNSLPYLAPIYDTIASYKKPKKVQALLESFALGITDKRLKELVKAIRIPLSEQGCFNEVVVEGAKKEKGQYIPKPELVTQIIEKVRAEFLEEGKISEDVLCLSVLLVETNLIKNYFSKVEVNKMKARIKEVRNSDAYESVKDIFDYMDAVAAVIIIMTSN